MVKLRVMMVLIGDFSGAGSEGAFADFHGDGCVVVEGTSALPDT